jgi:DNA-directed RNA polymerase specialized sigma24 family protein
MQALVNEFLSCLMSARSAQDQGSQSRSMACLHQASKPFLRIERFARTTIANKWPMLDSPQDASQEALTRLVKAYLDPRSQPPHIEGNGFNYVYTVILNTARDALRDQIRHGRHAIRQGHPAHDGNPSPVVATAVVTETDPAAEGTGESATADGAGWLDESDSFTHDFALSLDVLRRIDEFARTYKDLPKDRMPHPEMLRHMVEGSSTLDIAHSWFERDVTLTEESRVKKWKEATRNVAQVFFQDLSTGRKG